MFGDTKIEKKGKPKRRFRSLRLTAWLMLRLAAWLMILLLYGRGRCSAGRTRCPATIPAEPLRFDRSAAPDQDMMNSEFVTDPEVEDEDEGEIERLDEDEATKSRASHQDRFKTGLLSCRWTSRKA
jgi:hypothetical protein